MSICEARDASIYAPAQWAVRLYEQATYAPATPRSKQTLAPPNRQRSLLAASSFSRRQDSKELSPDRNSGWAGAIEPSLSIYSFKTIISRALAPRCPALSRSGSSAPPTTGRGIREGRREDATATAAALTGASTGTSAAVAAMGGEADRMDGD